MRNDDGTWSVMVPGWGSKDSRLVIIGEAPGVLEINHHPPMPFCGPSGWRLNEWMTGVGLQRTDAYIDNVYPYRAPGNKMERVPKLSVIPWLKALHERLAALDDPWLIVPMGNYALYALLGLGKVSWHKKDGRVDRPGITSHRGYIYEYRDLNNRCIKVIPSIHPSATFDMPTLERAAKMDWEKIAADLQFRDTALPHRPVLSNPTPADITAFYQRVTSHPMAQLALDIERPAGQVTVKGRPTKAYPDGKPTKRKDYRAGKIVCISFSVDPWADTITIPTTRAYWAGQGIPDYDYWGWIRALLTTPNPKVTQNGLYDCWHLADQEVPITNWAYDTLYLHHALNPRDQHSLEYMASMYLRTRYWKDEAKDPGSLTGWTDRQDKLRHYCGLDSSHTVELAMTFLDRFDADSWQRYLDHYWALLPALLRLMRHGLRVDISLATSKRAALDDELKTLKTNLKAITGVDLIANKAISVVKLKEYLYRTLKLPEQYEGRGRAKTVTTNEIAIKTLASRFPERLTPAISDAILRTRRVLKLKESYEPTHFDPDGRMRSTYSPNTQQGRLSSKKNPSGSGTNGQNIDVEARDVYVADEGKVMLVVDLSQAESRVNRAYIHSLTGDEETLWKARALPAEWDDHTAMTERIFASVTDPAEIKQLRPLGKKIVHASQRQMQAETLAKNILKEMGEVVLPSEADRLLRLAVNAQPGLLDFFRWVQTHVQMSRRVTSCWGVSLWFTYDRLDANTYRDAISFMMQDAVGRLTNQYGVRWMWEEPEHRWQSGVVELNAQWHDGLLMSMPPDPVLIHQYLDGLMTSLNQPRDYNGVPLRIPATAKIGWNTSGHYEWKHCPSVEEIHEQLLDMGATPTTI